MELLPPFPPEETEGTELIAVGVPPAPTETCNDVTEARGSATSRTCPPPPPPDDP